VSKRAETSLGVADTSVCSTTLNRRSPAVARPRHRLWRTSSRSRVCPAAVASAVAVAASFRRSRLVMLLSLSFWC